MMSKQILVVAFGVLLSGGVMAADYNNLPDTERNYAEGTTFKSVTHYLDNERVELDQQKYDAFVREQGGSYDPALYQGN